MGRDHLPQILSFPVSLARLMCGFGRRRFRRRSGLPIPPLGLFPPPAPRRLPGQRNGDPGRPRPSGDEGDLLFRCSWCPPIHVVAGPQNPAPDLRRPGGTIFGRVSQAVPEPTEYTLANDLVKEFVVSRTHLTRCLGAPSTVQQSGEILDASGLGDGACRWTVQGQGWPA